MYLIGNSTLSLGFFLLSLRMGYDYWRQKELSRMALAVLFFILAVLGGIYVLQKGSQEGLFITSSTSFISAFVELVLLPIFAFQCGRDYLQKRKNIDLAFGCLLFGFFFLSCITWLQRLIRYFFLEC